MNQNVDMHVHTYYSDGSLSPTEIIKWAKDKGLDTVAITDHDGVKGIQEAMTAGKELGIRVIPGIELSAQTEEGLGLHILGYDINPTDRRLMAACNKMEEARRRRNQKLFQALKELGYSLELDQVTREAGRTYVGKPDIALALVKQGKIQSIQEAFRPGGVFSDKSIRRLKKEKISAEEAIRLIRGAGGTAVLAHPVKIRKLGDRNSETFYSHLQELLIRLAAKGLEGMECIYPEHTDEEAVRLSVMAHGMGLKITGGSDYHGPEFDGQFID